MVYHDDDVCVCVVVLLSLRVLVSIRFGRATTLTKPEPSPEPSLGRTSMPYTVFCGAAPFRLLLCFRSEVRRVRQCATRGRSEQIYWWPFKFFQFVGAEIWQCTVPLVIMGVNDRQRNVLNVANAVSSAKGELMLIRFLRLFSSSAQTNLFYRF